MEQTQESSSHRGSNKSPGDLPCSMRALLPSHHTHRHPPSPWLKVCNWAPGGRATVSISHSQRFSAQLLVNIVGNICSIKSSSESTSAALALKGESSSHGSCLNNLKFNGFIEKLKGNQTLSTNFVLDPCGTVASARFVPQKGPSGPQNQAAQETPGKCGQSQQPQSQRNLCSHSHEQEIRKQ